jgi:cobalt-zinc-cadmium efflux system membrane fusion protein
MFDDNLLSEMELLESKRKLQQIQASLSKIKSDMNVYGAEKENGIFTVHAPMSGFITHKKASLSSMISPESDPVFTIADLNTVWVIANVYASNLLCVREGLEVEMTTFSYPNEKFHGKIDALSQVFDPEERVLKARIVMDNNNLKLKPEMSMLITLKDKAAQHLLAIPSESLIFDDNQYFVVVKETTGNFTIRNVVPQGGNNQTSYISSGLREGEKVVVKDQLLIYSELKEGVSCISL